MLEQNEGAKVLNFIGGVTQLPDLTNSGGQFLVQGNDRNEIDHNLDLLTNQFLNAGTAASIYRMSQKIPFIRNYYKSGFEKIFSGIAQMQQKGHSLEEIARWASLQRRQLVRNARLKQGVPSYLLLEIRDQIYYGLGGRSYKNIKGNYVKRGLSPSALHKRILKGSVRSNQGVNRIAKSLSGKMGTVLKGGGAIVSVVGLGFSARRVCTAKEHELPRVIGEETGSQVGGWSGGLFAGGLCVGFGIATGGLGLLGCALVGGTIGGFAGGWLGGRVGEAKLYAVSSREALQRANHDGILDGRYLLPVESIHETCEAIPLIGD